MHSPQPPTSHEQLAEALAELDAQRETYSATSVEDRIALVEACLAGVKGIATDWVTAACQAKEIPHPGLMDAEDWMTGPIATIRYLLLLRETLRDIARAGQPELPAPPFVGDDDRVYAPVFPNAGLYDQFVFTGFRANVRMLPDVTIENFGAQLATHYQSGSRPRAAIALVLGAGNVASIPATDAFYKLFHEGQLVLLKMNPVNDYLGPLFERAFSRLIQRGFLRIVYGGSDIGAAAVHHPWVDSVHITGSHLSHDRIVWGSEGDDGRSADGKPKLEKPITSELGNVSPWIMVPGNYSLRQLSFQARNVAASVTNNASFNCVATKVLVTWKGWPARETFLDLLEQSLEETPRRFAYYPGAHERFSRFAGRAAEPEDAALPWTMLRDVDADSAPHLVQEESFVCVFAEVALDATSPESFLNTAVDFVNERLFGTLSAALTIAPSFRRAGNERLLEDCLARLRYGTIGINHWPGMVYFLMSPPWGGHPGSTLSDPQSGIGWVHNTFMLSRAEKTILEGPLTVVPRPAWFASHRRADSVARSLFRLYCDPSPSRLLPLVLNSLRA